MRAYKHWSVCMPMERNELAGLWEAFGTLINVQRKLGSASFDGAFERMGLLAPGLRTNEGCLADIKYQYRDQSWLGLGILSPT